MKLAAVGVVAALIGIALGIPGLIGIGAYWVVLGPVMRRHGQRIRELQRRSQAESPPSGSRTYPPIDARTFWIGTVLWMLLGIPSLAVGILGLGIPAEQGGWRWLPIVVGGLAAGVGVLGAILHLTGAAALAAAGAAPVQQGTTAEPGRTEGTDVASRLDELDRLHREDRITLEEYESERKRILRSI